MTDLTHVNIPTELFVLPLNGVYEMSFVALMYNFDNKGLKISNGDLAKTFKTDVRTVERLISRLRKKKYFYDSGTGKNDRCLRLCTDIMSGIGTGIMPGKIPTSGVVSTDMTADHNKEVNITKAVESDFVFVLKGEKQWHLPPAKLGEYVKTYPNIDVEAELYRSAQWLIDNPNKRKTADGMLRYVNGWLGRAKPPKPQAKKDKARPFTPEVEEDFLSKMTSPATDEQIAQLEAEGLI